MSCHTLREELTDVARGRDVGRGTVAAVESHVEHCASCRGRFMHERRLSEGLRALAESTRDMTAPAALEAQLLEAFAARHADPAARTTVAAQSQWNWMRAAAAIVVAAGLLAAWLIVSRSRSHDVPATATSSPTTSSPVLEQAKPQPPQTASSAGSAIPRPRTPKPRPSRIVRPEGFVALPSAAGLPAFESGEIVRVEVPIASLPLYGIEIVPDTRGAPVEADFLVAQDGRARAIRLVHTASPSSSSLK
jgi:hypothetical protein